MALKLVAAPGFQQDVYDLPTLALRKRAMELSASVANGELHGMPLDRRVATGDLSDCRKLYFDEDPRNQKPNYRLVYRSTPNEASSRGAGGRRRRRVRARRVPARPAEPRPGRRIASGEILGW